MSPGVAPYRIGETDRLDQVAHAAAFPRISRPAVSQHLRVLHDAGLVAMRPDGNRRLYRAQAEGLAEVWQFIDSMWTDRLAKLKRAAERAERRQARRARTKRSNP